MVDTNNWYSKTIKANQQKEDKQLKKYKHHCSLKYCLMQDHNNSKIKEKSKKKIAEDSKDGFRGQVTNTITCEYRPQ